MHSSDGFQIGFYEESAESTHLVDQTMHAKEPSFIEQYSVIPVSESDIAEQNIRLVTTS